MEDKVFLIVKQECCDIEIVKEINNVIENYNLRKKNG